MKIDNRIRALKAARICQDKEITQSEIASAVGASQSQVSRILSGSSVTSSRLFEDVCLFAEQYGVGVTAEAVCQNEDLIDAMRSVWDGSSSHARALATVIRALSILGSHFSHSNNEGP